MVAAGVSAPFALGLAAKQSLDGVIESDQTLQRSFGNITWPTLLPFVAVVAILPAFAVEILFRGYVQRRLLERWPPWVAIVFSSLGYMLVHMDVSNALFSLPPAIWFGWIAWKTNSVWPSIGSHMLGLVAWGLTAGLMGLTGNETLPIWFNLVAVGVGLAITGWAVRIVLAQRGVQRPRWSSPTETNAHAPSVTRASSLYPGQAGSLPYESYATRRIARLAAAASRCTSSGVIVRKVWPIFGAGSSARMRVSAWIIRGT